MSVKHHLSCVRVTVRDHAVPALINAQASGNCRGHAEDVPDDGCPLRGDVVKGRDVLLRNDDNVDGRGGVYVLEGQADVVLEDNLGRDLPAGNLAEDAIVHESGLPARWVSQDEYRGQTARSKWLAGVAFLLFSCASVSAPNSKDLQGVVKQFHHDLRWKYYDAAAACVNPEHSQAFIEDVENEKSELNISGWEIRKVELFKDGSEAKIRVQFNFYRMPSTVVQTVTAEQVWQKIGDGWFLFEQEKGPFVLPPAGADKQDPGAPEGATHP